MASLIAVSRKDLLESHGIPFTRNTLLKWHHLGKNLDVFTKIGGRLFINVNAWNAMVARCTAPPNSDKTKKENSIKGEIK